MEVLKNNNEEMDRDLIAGMNIKSYRKMFGFTQESLGKLIGVSRTVMNYFEKGTRSLSMVQLSKLSEIFDIEISDLLSYDEDRLKINSSVAFRKEKLTNTDLVAISQFRRICKNYVKLNENF